MVTPDFVAEWLALRPMVGVKRHPCGSGPAGRFRFPEAWDVGLLLGIGQPAPTSLSISGSGDGRAEGLEGLLGLDKAGGR